MMLICKLILLPNPMLLPIALFASLSRRDLGTRNEGLWGHWISGIGSGIFELIQIFSTGHLKTKKSWNGSQNVRADIAAMKIWNSCDQPCSWRAIRQLNCKSFSFTVWPHIKALKSETTKINYLVDPHQESKTKGNNWKLNECQSLSEKQLDWWKHSPNSCHLTSETNSSNPASTAAIDNPIQCILLQTLQLHTIHVSHEDQKS